MGWLLTRAWVSCCCCCCSSCWALGGLPVHAASARAPAAAAITVILMFTGCFPSSRRGCRAGCSRPGRSALSTPAGLRAAGHLVGLLAGDADGRDPLGFQRGDLLRVAGGLCDGDGLGVHVGDLLSDLLAEG